MARKEKVCQFCGELCEVETYNLRWYDKGTNDLHVKRCPNRARHYHEQAMDRGEDERQKRFSDYNQLGTETSEGRRYTEGLELLNEDDDE